MASPVHGKIPVQIFHHSDIVAAVVVMTIVMMMIIPLPAAVLDILLILNITFALMVLLIAMNTTHPLQFSIFPSLLLLATLYRLALNVSTTRLILLHGYAGRVILSFGQFVVGGNPVVGFIVFLILVIIQFIVITKGAERVAEVAARFTLDAMPGKQMSIDADLNAGIISDTEAQTKRLEIRREADFYGAMDGASKFVKGDAIAGIIITLINICGGFIIGVIQEGMVWQQALQQYTLLTVGDGLLAQIPALLISTATGLVVTRAASENNLGEEFLFQLLSQPRVLGIAATLLGILAIIPGLPGFPFLIMAGFTGFLSHTLRQPHNKMQIAQQQVAPEKPSIPDKQEDLLMLLKTDPLEIELGYSLVSLADPEQGGDLLERIVMIRRQLAAEMGFIVPTVRVRDNMHLASNLYNIRLRGIQVASGELMPGYLLAMRPDDNGPQLSGIATKEPTFGLPALWLREEQRHEAVKMNYTVVEPAAVLATHLTEVIKEHASELLGRQEVKVLIDSVKESYPAVVDELYPNILGLGEIERVLGNLLREGVSIRNLVTIFETLADYGSLTKDTDLLTEYVRQSLARQISQLYRNEQGVLPVIILAPEVEDVVRSSLQQSESGNYLAIDPKQAENIIGSLDSRLQEALGRGQQPVILCSPVVRFYLRRLVEKKLPRVPVLSYNELPSDLEVQVIGRVSSI
jgi:flagellar biosynthesis protein FlhA